MPSISCVTRSILTPLYTLNHSGWWFILSAFIATFVINPNACTKSSNSNVLFILPLTTFQLLSLPTSCSISVCDNLRYSSSSDMKLIGTMYLIHLAHLKERHPLGSYYDCSYCKCDHYRSDAYLELGHHREALLHHSVRVLYLFYPHIE